jgi:hypothetical protein
MFTKSDPTIDQRTIVPVRPATATEEASADGARAGLLRRTLGRGNYSRRTLGKSNYSRRTLGKNNYSRRTLGKGTY